jgi:hypothetical protein
MLFYRSKISTRTRRGGGGPAHPKMARWSLLAVHGSRPLLDEMLGRNHYGTEAMDDLGMDAYLVNSNRAAAVDSLDLGGNGPTRAVPVAAEDGR